MKTNKELIKAIAIGVAMILLAAYAALGASAATATTTDAAEPVKWALHEESIFSNLHEAEITHMETLYKKNAGTVCVLSVVTDDWSGFVNCSQSQYSLLHEGDKIAIVQNENGAWQYVNTPQTATFVSDFVKDGKHTYAVVENEGGVPVKVKVGCEYVHDTRLGTDVVLTAAKNGEPRIEGYSYNAEIITIIVMAIIGIVILLFFVCIALAM